MLDLRYIHDLSRLSDHDLDDIRREARRMAKTGPSDGAGWALVALYLADEVTELRGRLRASS